MKTDVCQDLNNSPGLHYGKDTQLPRMMTAPQSDDNRPTLVHNVEDQQTSKGDTQSHYQAPDLPNNLCPNTTEQLLVSSCLIEQKRRQQSQARL